MWLLKNPKFSQKICQFKKNGDVRNPLQIAQLHQGYFWLEIVRDGGNKNDTQYIRAHKAGREYIFVWKDLSTHIFWFCDSYVLYSSNKYHFGCDIQKWVLVQVTI